MSVTSQRSMCLTVLVFWILGMPGVATAHFAWLSTDDEDRVLLFFGESQHQRDYHTPAAVAEAKVWLKDSADPAKPVDLKAVEEQTFVGRQSEPGIAERGIVATQCQYGVYHGTLLTYYVKHYAQSIDDVQHEIADDEQAQLALDVRPVRIDRGIQLQVTWEGKPAAGASVTLVDSNGEQAEKQTGEDGTVKFYHVAEGELGFLIGHVQDDASGEVDGEAYESASHYLTLTFTHAVQPAADTQQSAVPPLPEPIASFGAAVTEGYLYVYSGHTGTAHAHSRDNLSKHFVRVNVDGGQWEDLPMQTPLQGFALVAHEGLVYRVGGMHARNAPDEEEDLHSVDEFAVFDPQAGTWTDLPQLPEPRSSHDAVVIGDRLYVVGGWQLSGSDEGKWHDTAWRIDLTHPVEGWQPLAEPPFRRRALAASHFDGKLVAVGGMDDEHGISRRVDALDLETGEWQQLADLPGEGMHGFGISAWNAGGHLYASGTEGVLYRLADDGSKWTAAAKLDDRRFFHRLLGADDRRLLIIAGASLDREGHVADSEWVPLEDVTR